MGFPNLGVPCPLMWLKRALCRTEPRITSWGGKVDIITVCTDHMLLLFSIMHFFRSVELFSFITVKSCFCFHAPVSFVINIFFFHVWLPLTDFRGSTGRKIDVKFFVCLHRSVTLVPVMNAEFPKCIPSRLQKVAQMMNLRSRHLSMQGMKWECYQTLYLIKKTPVKDLKLYRGTKMRDPLKKTDLRSLGMQLTADADGRMQCTRSPAHSQTLFTAFHISVCRSYFSLTYSTHIKK